MNNPTAADLEAARTAVLRGQCTYVVFCHEVGASGTRHLQGFASAGGNKLTMSAWHKAIGNRFALPQGWSFVKSIPDCIQYCKGFERKLNEEGVWDGKSYEKKAGSEEYEEYGTYQPGKRTDMLVLKRKIDEYEDPEDLIRDPDHFGTLGRSWKFFKQYRDIVCDLGVKRKTIEVVKCREMPKVYIRWGDPGCGKTKWVEDTFGENAHYLMPIGKPDKRFYGYYDRHITVLYNEFTAHKYSCQEFCDTFDHQGPLVETKGGHVKFKPLNVILTSTKPPRQWYDQTDTDWDGFVRRIYCCKHIFKLNGEIKEECDPDFCKHGLQEEVLRNSEQASAEEVHTSHEEEASDSQVSSRTQRFCEEGQGCDSQDGRDQVP